MILFPLVVTMSCVVEFNMLGLALISVTDGAS